MKTYYDIKVTLANSSSVLKLKGVSYSTITQLAVQGESNGGPIENITILKEYSKKQYKY